MIKQMKLKKKFFNYFFSEWSGSIKGTDFILDCVHLL